MLDEPGPQELLAAVIRFLRETVVPALPQRDAFEARVAANALELVQRDIALGRDSEAAEQARLVGLLGRDGDLGELNAALSDTLRAADPDALTAAIRDHLWATTFEKLAVDQPRYSAYLRALDEREAAAKKN